VRSSGIYIFSLLKFQRCDEEYQLRRQILDAGDNSQFNTVYILKSGKNRKP